ncbi:Exopolysaccharide biosynthesis protein YbjH [Roseivivax lentus]|uniref:Exopolysaccharide biosynthesis protein YbjH n=2 Tax=Roseivivax lentus TaxID=633194 RepID=A0A1N7P6R3_9RHOB|nr:Exopolysaccharide biosynthesis protein YbjH [Roseivivax lentus]
MPGMVDMPNALVLPDAELGFSVSQFEGTTRITGAFQILPRVTGSFRYSSIDDFRGGDTNFDRSFSIHYQMLEERQYRPALALGINDLFGTGIYSGEYLVATKHLMPRLLATGGIGWGRLGERNGFRNPLGVLNDAFETRPGRDFGVGGEAEFDQIFRGDAAFFGGLEFQASERLSFAVEYSSDEYSTEDGPTFDYESPWNFGMTYKVRQDLSLTAAYMYGSAVGLQLTYAINPKRPPNSVGLEAAPYPVTPRSSVDAEALGWTLPDNGQAAIGQVRDVMLADGIALHAFRLDASTVRVEIENQRYRTTAQAVGRTARILTASMPPAVDTFVIVPTVRGIRASQIVIRRDDMEELAYDLDNSWSSYARARIEAATTEVRPFADIYPRFDWNIRPYLTPSFFDPDDPARFDVGVEVNASVEPVAGVLFEGAVRQRIEGTLDESTRPSDSVLPKVRSETNIFQRNADTFMTYLTGNYFFKPAQDFYARVTVGYFETQYGGISTELLWKPVGSDLAFGVEANYVKQREFEQGFGFQDYEVATGHATVYYTFENGFEARVDAGRYLAGDWGATLTLQRTFKNGWRVGAFATLTDVPFDEFGEGSFDKGLMITIPIDWVRGTPTTNEFNYILRPILRDGGAKVNIRNRLYELVDDNHRPDLQDDWGRFWK